MELPRELCVGGCDIQHTACPVFDFLQSNALIHIGLGFIALFCTGFVLVPDMDESGAVNLVSTYCLIALFCTGFVLLLDIALSIVSVFCF